MFELKEYYCSSPTEIFVPAYSYPKNNLLDDLFLKKLKIIYPIEIAIGPIVILAEWKQMRRALSKRGY